MKKLLALVLSVMMVSALAACGNKPSNEDLTAGETLLANFKEIAGEKETALEIAEEISKNEIIPFMAMTAPVEPGWLNGFSEDVEGFSEGVFFGPAISTIPFAAYVFTLEDGADADAFIADLEAKANLRWNICTEADEMVSGKEGNKVFFCMTTKTFEEEPVEDQIAE